jgi:hypothetical protein
MGRPIGSTSTSGKGWIELDFQVKSQSSTMRIVLMCSQGAPLVAAANVRANGGVIAL